MGNCCCPLVAWGHPYAALHTHIEDTESKPQAPANQVSNSSMGKWEAGAGGRRWDTHYTHLCSNPQGRPTAGQHHLRCTSKRVEAEEVALRGTRWVNGGSWELGPILVKPIPCSALVFLGPQVTAWAQGPGPGWAVARAAGGPEPPLLDSGMRPWRRRRGSGKAFLLALALSPCRLQHTTHALLCCPQRWPRPAGPLSRVPDQLPWKRSPRLNAVLRTLEKPPSECDVLTTS